MQPQSYNKHLVSSILDLGEILLISGAEVNRIEDTVTRICQAYGFLRIDIFTITTSIVLTVHTAEDEIITQTRRILRYDTDMNKVAQANCLSRDICARRPELSYIREQIARIQKSDKYPVPVIYLTYAVIAAAFTCFYGGGPMDALAAAAAGLLMRLVQSLGQRIRMQTFILTFLTSAATGFAILLLVALGIGSAVHTITIGCVMLLIPGLAMTTSFRDMISGDIVSGMLGLTEALLRAMAIALGFAFVLMQIGG
ncbi:MAG: threonine/serine exporter family protein [Lachnospiraceae bacterium]|nr:threonine/serine exporter family protein [Lachnospiraceae bacterium]